MESILKLGYRKRYYMKHPIRLAREILSNFRAARSRIKVGYCASDVWNMNDWILDTFPPMLRMMADKGCGYPGCEPFETPEKWHDWLYEIADKLESCKEDERDKRNEYYEEYMGRFEKNANITMTCAHPNMSQDEIQTMYFKRSSELFDESEANVRYCMSQLGQHFFKLWD